MKREDIIETLIAMLKELHSELCDDEVDIDPSTCPVGGMSHFDSLMGVIATVRCFDKFNITDEKTVSLFESKKNGEPLTIGDVADKIVTLIGKE